MAVDGVLLDIDGVLAVSWNLLPGAVEAVTWLRSEDVPFRLLTNTTELTRRELGRRLRTAGLDVDPEEIVTAPLVTAAYLRRAHAGAGCYVLAAVDLSEDLEGIRTVEEDADVVVVGGATDPFTADQAGRALRMVADGAALVAMHRSISWMTDRGAMLDAGVMLVAGLEEATGGRAVVCGKPSGECFLRAAEMLGTGVGRTAVVGDDVANDVLAGQAVGMTGVLVRTGKFRPSDLAGAGGKPDHVIGSVAELPDLLGRLRS